MKARTETLYVKIKEDIKSRIEAGEYSSGERIMSETEICDCYQVSRISAKRALNELRNEGYITRIPGKGSFVSFPQIEYDLKDRRIYDLESELREKGMSYSAKMLYFGKIKASDIPGQMGVKARAELRVDENVPMFYIQKLHYANEEIIALDNIFMPCEVCPDLTEQEALSAQNMRSALRVRHHRRVNRAKEFFYARPVTLLQSEWLKVNPSSAALVVLHVGFCGEEPIEFLYRIYKGERSMYSVELSGEVLD